jgi:hypothetical protein
MELLGDVAQMEAHFGLFGDSVKLDARLHSCAKCAIRSDFILGPPDGTLRVCLVWEPNEMGWVHSTSLGWNQSISCLVTGLGPTQFSVWLEGYIEG